MCELRKIAAVIILDDVIHEEEEKEKRCNKKKRLWSKEWLLEKEQFSDRKLLKKLKETEPIDFKNYMRMDDNTFLSILEMIKPCIGKQDTVMRSAVPAEDRLAITLRYLATGRSFADLKFSSAVSPHCIGRIVMETCKAINNALKDYIKLPKSSDEWREVADKFYARSGFPHCIGALDGKHVQIKKPHNSGSYYFNYKKTYSIVLMALVNSDSEFLMVDIGANGRVSDGGVFSSSKFFDKLEENKLKLPEEAKIIEAVDPLPYVIVADDAFALRHNIMKPFSYANLSAEDQSFNKRLSSARVKVENAFGILSSRFQVISSVIRLAPKKAEIIVLTCCYLHNYLKKRNGSIYSSTPANPFEDPNGMTLTPMEPTMSRNATLDAKNTRKNFSLAISYLESGYN